jgi:N-methylhydantoinase A/oxoprolinase/acetone carboxylase beta subunit
MHGSTEHQAPNGVGREGIGLGIDAGGTYTDAVLFDFGVGRVLAKRKALTTHWDYARGIGTALADLDPALLAQAKLVAVSTTLATNAIVEGRGQKAGLLVMPPYGWREVQGFKHAPLEIVDGQLEIDGSVRAPVNREQVRRIARKMVAEHGVGAFAVGGYASHANPAHEQAVKAHLVAETGLGVTCAHELSEGLNYRVRAETAALNARIIPCLKALLDRLRAALEAVGVTAPVMIVRSDGSMMSMALAAERPLETMLSGPAASVAGAAWLAGLSDALVVDVGGTTTDTAVVRGGVVDLCGAGATIGGWQTHIPALNLRTVGLGGDSHVRVERGVLRFGPERVAPVCWLAAVLAGTDQALDWVAAHVEPRHGSDEEVVLYATVGSPDGLTLTREEQALLALLKERPRSAAEAAAVMEKQHYSLLPWRRLVGAHVVQRCALTTTDALHVAGRIKLWNGRAAAALCEWHARRARQDVATFVRTLLLEFERRLAAELFKRQLAAESDVDGIDIQPAAMDLLNRALGSGVDGYRVRIELPHPVVGVGAPAGCLVPGAAGLLHAECIVPEHADVANAIGAITGSVALRRRVTVAVNEQGVFRLEGVPDAPAFTRIEAATAYGETYLRELLDALARKAGAVDPVVRIEIRDSAANASGGESIFIGRIIEGHAYGQPGLG